MPKFEPFVTRFQCRTGLKLQEKLGSSKDRRERYREYHVTSNSFALFSIGVSLDDDAGPIIGMVSQPDMYELDPESSAHYRRQ